MAAKDYRSEVGKLMKIDFDPNFGYRYIVWFDYTKKLMRELRVGDLIAIPNFSDGTSERATSILSISSLMPFHYAAGDDLSGYPTFLEKTRDEAYKDFDQQVDESKVDTTKIEVNAAPTGLEFRGTPAEVVEESQIPVFGGEARVLDQDLVSQVYNRGLTGQKTITLGKLTKGQIDISLKSEDLVRTHIAVFGYTGTGKSNLVSTLVNKLLTQDKTPVNVVIFDLMGEYLPILLDVLLKVDGFMGFLEADSLSENVRKFMSGDAGYLTKAAADFVNGFQIPATLRSKEVLEWYKGKTMVLLAKGKIKVLYEEAGTLEGLLQRNIPSFRGSQESRQVMGKIFGMFGKKENTPGNIKALLKQLRAEAAQPDLKAGTEELLRGWLDAIEPLEGREPFKPEKKYRFDKDSDLVDRLIDPTNENPSLHIIYSDHTDTERKFAYEVVSSEKHSVYSERRRHGTNSPLTLFVFDEADDYIPGPNEPKGSYAQSTDAVETLARRGRKFGLGVLIATQRVTYLNTNIMAQPHTYFISKLPRASDRLRVTEAFGIPEDMLRETFKFRKGDWLIISHDATGLTGVPIPVHADNAEDRVRASTKP